jgi:spore coat polysaccharide biosynthesis protein SpsF
MRTAAVIFARMDSSRLPGKVLADVAGKPLLHHVVKRAERSGEEVIIATSIRPIDEPIARFAHSHGLRCFCGGAEDVLGRAFVCGMGTRLDALIRISGDSPFIDPHLIKRVAEVFRTTEKLDLATNVFPRTYPPGLSVEVISVNALAIANAATVDQEDREHVTRYFYRNSNSFRIVNCPAERPSDRNLRLTVDEPADLDRASWMIRAGAGADAPLEEVLRLAEEYPSSARDG